MSITKGLDEGTDKKQFLLWLMAEGFISQVPVEELNPVIQKWIKLKIARVSQRVESPEVTLYRLGGGR
jgi:hypothetical protein